MYKTINNLPLLCPECESENDLESLKDRFYTCFNCGYELTLSDIYKYHQSIIPRILEIAEKN